MTRQLALWLGCICGVGLMALGLVVGCTGGQCSNDQDCSSTEMCLNGECTARGTSSSGGGREGDVCATDDDCVEEGLKCKDLVCTLEGGEACSSTTQCPMDQWCNLNVEGGVCQSLQAGFCRQDGQCPADKSHCFAAAGGVGRCVECLLPEHCTGGAICSTNGRCLGGASSGPVNSSGGVVSSTSHGTTSSTASSTATSGCGQAQADQCRANGGVWRSADCKCIFSNTSGSSHGGTSSSAACSVPMGADAICSQAGGSVDMVQCMCVPPNAPAGAGCALSEVTTQSMLCGFQQLPLDLAACACMPNVGATCTQDTECKGGGLLSPATCWLPAGGKWSGGYCTLDCTLQSYCGSPNFCVAGDGFSSYCMAGCDPAQSQCRSEYRCHVLRDSFGQATGGVCGNPCTSSSDCGGGTCNTSTGACQ